MFIKSIRWRWLLWLAFLLACVLTGFGVTAYRLHRTQRFEQIDEDLESRVAALTRELRVRPGSGHPRGRPWFERMPDSPGDRNPLRGPESLPPGPPQRPADRRPPPFLLPPRAILDARFEGREFTLSPATLGLFDESSPHGFYYAIWSRAASLLKSSSNAPPALPIPGPGEAENRIQTRTRGTFREAFQLNSIGECVLAGRPIAADLVALRHFAWWLATAGAAVLALGLGGGWMLTTRAIRPVEHIGTAARRIADGHLEERIRLADTDSDSELGRLADVLNSTFARLESAFAQQKQFTADASHELRTPLSVIIAEAQTTLARERSAAEYRETVETCLDAAQQMRRLTHSLLELARFDAGQERLEKAPLELAACVRACTELIRPLAEARGILVEAELHAVEIQGDPDRLSQVFTNLLTNAVHYNHDHGHIRITTGTHLQTHTAIVTIADTGRGIAAEDLPHVFKRFFRADKSRSLAAGRSGLGLAISKAILDAHQGTLEVASEPGSGTTFTVRLPR